MSKATAEWFTKTQAFKSLECLRAFTPDDMEATIGRHKIKGTDQVYGL